MNRRAGIFVVAGLIGAMLVLPRLSANRDRATTLSYSRFVSDVTADRVETATIASNGEVGGTLTDGTQYRSQIPVALGDDDLATLLQEHDVEVTGESTPSNALLGVVMSVLPLLLLVGLFVFFGRRLGRQMTGGMGAVTRSKARLNDAEIPTRFSDVAGYETAKREVSEVVDFLKDPSRYSRAGAIGPRGVLMVGPPGTGKTMLARAVAGEAGVPFFSAAGSSFVEMFVGVGASRVRDLFAKARERSPSIVFIDEIDAIGQRRGRSIVGNDEREQTLNQLLAEMDGFDASSGVVVIAATNRPETLDPALLRPGRFDRHVEIPLPNVKERAAILSVHAEGKPLGLDVDLETVARGTPGFSGADLANLLNEAAIVAVRDSRDVVTARDFDEARDRVLLGLRNPSSVLLPDERRTVAVHEAGHALVALLSEHADPVSKVSILPIGRALGVTEQLPVDDRHLYPESYLRASLAVRMGGRVAERLVLGEVSSGAANDLSTATELARRMVRDFGMSAELGPVAFSMDSPGYLGGQETGGREHADATQREIDRAVSRVLREAERAATELLTGRPGALDRVVELLIEKEAIDGTALEAAVAEVAGASPVEPAAA